MSLVSMIRGNGPSGFGYGSTAEDVTAGLSLSGRTFLVTGAASGLGRETVRVLAHRGARVVATGRTAASVQAACAGFEGDIVPLECDLAKPSSVDGCVARVRRDEKKLDVIVCNAGIMALAKLEQAFGYELQFFTNHIGHFMLVTGLLEHLEDKARLVVLSSAAHTNTPKGGVEFDNLSGEKGYSPWKAYGQSKLCNLLFAKALAGRWAGTGRTANALHPGVIATQLLRHLPGIARSGVSLIKPLFFKSIAEGAATQCYVATNPGLDAVTGQYFSDCNIARPSAFASDPALAARLWDESVRIVEKVRAAAS